jgi:hypothetical protein
MKKSTGWREILPTISANTPPYIVVQCIPHFLEIVGHGCSNQLGTALSSHLLA